MGSFLLVFATIHVQVLSEICVATETTTIPSTHHKETAINLVRRNTIK